jgi:hypothetical protein
MNLAVGARGRNPHGETWTYRYPRRIGSVPVVVMKVVRAADIAGAGGDVPVRVADALVSIDIQGRSPGAPVVGPDRFYVAGVCIGG